MSNLLVFDYDNTIVIHKNIKTYFRKRKTKNNIISIQKNINNDDFVMISTGRYYKGIRQELHDNKIEYEYLSCNYGTELYDKNDNLLYSIPISRKDVDIIIKKKYKNIEFHRATNNDITSINIYLNNEEMFNQEYEYLSNNLNDSRILKKFPKLKIIQKNVDKTIGIEYVEKLYYFNKIYAIGDSLEDKKMLEKYNGYTLPWGIKNIKKTSSVAKFIKQIKQENNIPTVLCIGFAKCGTTTLYNIFEQNKNIHLCGIKEPVYYGYKKLYKRGFDWYKKRYYSINTQKKIIEINPRIAKYATADMVLKDYGKNIKIIIFIRNPIKRLYSNFKMNLNTGKCFSKRRENVDKNTKKLFDKWVKENFKIKKNNIELKENINTNKMLNGKYYEVISDYINTFGKENIYVCFFEDFVKDIEKHSKKIFDFINVKYEKIDYNIHINKGNRVPRNSLDIIVNNFFINKVWKDIIIGKLPYISNKFSKFCNNLVWKCPIIFSKENNDNNNISEYSTKILTLYYYDMITKLSELLEEDLFSKWKLERDKDELWKF